MRQDSPKTIQIFLPGGDPQGIRVAELTMRIIRLIEVPRTLVGSFLKMQESSQVGVYFLVGENEVTGTPHVYIGQSGSVGARIAQHNQSKDFWGRALVAVSLTNNMTDTHARFLEWLSIKSAVESGRYSIENGNGGARPFTPAPLEADCLEMQDTVGVLLATLGHPIFSSIAKTPGPLAVNEAYFCKSSGADGKGQYNEEGFVVFAGSSGRVETVASFFNTSGAKLRARLIEQGVIKEEAGRMVFLKNHLFNTPSAASDVILGRNSNGWTEWKDARGVTLDANERGAVSLIPSSVAVP